MKKTGAVLVAAGLSSRMMHFKPMLPFRDSTIAMQMVIRLKKMGMNPITVVTGYRGDELEKHLCCTGVRFVRNQRYTETEMFDSVVIGVTDIFNDCQRIVIMPIDVPAIREDTFRQILRVDAELIRTVCKGKPGHPVIISSRYAKTLCEYNGQRGLRGAMESSSIPITNIEVEDEGIYRDIDTSEAYKELLEWNYLRGEGYPVSPMIQIKLAANEVFFGTGCCEFLELIEKTGSMQEACIKMGLSYSKGSKMIKQIDRQLGFQVVERKAGGTGGGGSQLTAGGKRLIRNYRLLLAEVQEYTEKTYQKYFEKGIGGPCG